MSEYTFTKGRHNVHTLTAPYALLVKAFSNDGDNSRDDYKQMCQWDITAPNGESAEIYDYKVGKCYDSKNGLSREKITNWHVQGSDDAVGYLLVLLDKAEQG